MSDFTPLSIPNFGNTCFLNASVNALYSVTQQNIQLNKHFIIWFQFLASGTEQSREQVQGVVQALGMEFGKQQDSHEFCVKLLDDFHKKFPDPKSVSFEQQSDDAISPATTWKQVAHKQLVDHNKGQSSTVTKEFMGQFDTVIQCKTTLSKSRKFDPFTTLSLPIVEYEDEATTLEDLFNEFQETTEIEDYHCSVCKKSIQANHTTTFWSYPNVLFIHLKRFDSMGGKSKKNNTVVEIPELFELGNMETPVHYKLCSVIRHHGKSMNSGHYTCLIKTPSHWLVTDDSTITKVGVMDTEEISKDAYCLVYTKFNSTDNS